ncbi:MAG: hypothetical protein DIZ80_13980 [endosymbiont of Galathealinum brachiosum]|uniref:O-antigen ligase domain-containing protein n=1 Tax=endosymbiont of Galathealinum brachiosum TaxID=2200906 RepID=A0A370D8I2_9GAMM|nr:MAG: hypothetical protein DIZ80_13980 [endosymbiont of Galathealinum brachiosum]
MMRTLEKTSNQIYELLFINFILVFIVILSVVFVVNFCDVSFYSALFVYIPVMLLFFFLANKNIYYGLVILVAIVPIQPLFSMFISQYIDMMGAKVLVSIKESMVFVLLVIACTKNYYKVKLISVDYFLIIFFIIYSIAFVLSDAPLFVRLVSYREGAMIVMIYFLGRYSNLQLKELKLLMLSMFLVASGVLAFGFVERFLVGESFWGYVGALLYMELKFGVDNPGAWVMGGVPSQWYSYIGDVPYRRMVSSIGDAPTLSRYLAFSMLLSIVCYSVIISDKVGKIFIKYVVSTLFFLAMLFSIGRGGLLIALVGIMFFNFKYNKDMIFYIGLLILIFLVYMSVSGYIYSPVLSRHVAGLLGGMQSLLHDPFGIGLGTSGQMAVLYGEQKTGLVEESYVGSLAIQIGFSGVISYVVFMVALIRYLSNTIKFVGGNAVGLISRFSSAFMFGVFLTSFLANSSISPIVIINVLLVSGSIITIREKVEHKYVQLQKK